MEKNMKKKKVYMCITEALCCTAEINTLYINCTSTKINFYKYSYVEIKFSKVKKINFKTPREWAKKKKLSSVGIFRTNTFFKSIGISEPPEERLNERKGLSS